MRRGLEQELPADRQPDPTEPAGIDVGLTLQVCDRRHDILLPIPPEGVAVSHALAVPRLVEEQDPVAVSRAQGSRSRRT